MFKNERAVRFVVMVTPEDLKANAGMLSWKPFVVLPWKPFVIQGADPGSRPLGYQDIAPMDPQQSSNIRQDSVTFCKIEQNCAKFSNVL